MSGPKITVNLLQHIEPWQWPKEAAATILNTLRGRQESESDRVIAAELAGDLVVMNDDLAEVLMEVVADAGQPDELRARAAISFGPALEQSEIDEFEEDLTESKPPISEDTVDRVCDLLFRIYTDASAPKEVRRRALEAAVRAPQDWQTEAIRKEYASKDREWVLTAVFAMRFVKGFDAQIVNALKNPDDEIHMEAVQAAGAWEVDAAWSHVKALLESRKTPKELLIAAIEAVGSIRPAEAGDLLQDFADSDDEEIAEVAEETIEIAQARLDLGEDEL